MLVCVCVCVCVYVYMFLCTSLTAAAFLTLIFNMSYTERKHTCTYTLTMCVCVCVCVCVYVCLCMWVSYVIVWKILLLSLASSFTIFFFCCLLFVYLFCHFLCRQLCSSLSDWGEWDPTYRHWLRCFANIAYTQQGREGKGEKAGEGGREGGRGKEKSGRGRDGGFLYPTWFGDRVFVVRSETRHGQAVCWWKTMWGRVMNMGLWWYVALCPFLFCSAACFFSKAPARASLQIGIYACRSWAILSSQVLAQN